MLLSDLRMAVADQLVTIYGLTVSHFRTSNVQAPHAVITIPSGVYDATMGRGSDTLSVQVLVYVARSDDPTGLSILDEFVAGHGERSVKTAIEKSTGEGLSFVRVVSFEVGTVSSPDGSEYIAATFDAEAVVAGYA